MQNSVFWFLLFSVPEIILLLGFYCDQWGAFLFLFPRIILPLAECILGVSFIITWFCCYYIFICCTLFLSWRCFMLSCSTQITLPVQLDVFGCGLLSVWCRFYCIIERVCLKLDFGCPFIIAPFDDVLKAEFFCCAHVFCFVTCNISILFLCSFSKCCSCSQLCLLILIEYVCSFNLAENILQLVLFIS